MVLLSERYQPKIKDIYIRFKRYREKRRKVRGRDNGCPRARATARLKLTLTNMAPIFLRTFLYCT